MTCENNIGRYPLNRINRRKKKPETIRQYVEVNGI